MTRFEKNKKQILEIAEELFGFYEEIKEQEIGLNITINFRNDENYVDIFLFDRKNDNNCNSLFPLNLDKEKIINELRKKTEDMIKTRPTVDSKIRDLEEELKKLKEEKTNETN